MSNSAERGKKGRKPGGSGAAKAEPGEDGKTCLGEGVQPVAGGVFKSAAVAVLRAERRLMPTGEICRVALERGLIKCQGKTPEATMASALYTDVKRKSDKSVFTRPQEGLFGLREWVAQGFFPEGWVAPTDGSGVAPFKKRRGGGAERGTRTTPGRAAKGRASASWRKGSEGSDEEMEDAEEEGDDEDEEDEEGEEGEGTEATPDPEAAADAGADPPASTRSAKAAMTPQSAKGAGSGAGATPSSGTAAAATAAVPAVAPTVAVPAAAPAVAPAVAPAAAPAPAAAAAAAKDAGDMPAPSGRVSGSGAASRLTLPDLGDLPGGKDDLDSPLHVLGDAVLGSQGGPGRGRKRERPAFVQVPERSATVTLTGMSLPDGASTPRSPYEDSLAALHEIATSPNPYAANGIIDVTDRRRKPKLLLDVSDKPEGEGSPRRGAVAGKPPGLIVNVSLPTPVGGYINTPAIMAIPDLLPSARGGGPLTSSGAAGGALFSPNTLLQIQGLQTAGSPLPQGVARLERLVPQPSPLGLGGQGLQGSLLPMPRPLDLGGVGPAGGGQDVLGLPQFTEAAKMQAVTERLAVKLGAGHPQVARAWLAVARMFQNLGPQGGQEAAARTANALRHARDAAGNLAQAAGSALQQPCSSQFDYLLGRTGQQGVSTA